MGQNRCRRVSRGRAGGPKVRIRFLDPLFLTLFQKRAFFGIGFGDFRKKGVQKGSKNGVDFRRVIDISPAAVFGES